MKLRWWFWCAYVVASLSHSCCVAQSTPQWCHNVTISSSGTYNVTCPTPQISDWYIFMVGCSTNTSAAPGNDDDGVVTLLIHTPPTQIIVADIVSALPGTANVVATPSLEGCSVRITYANNTAVPAVGASSANQAHVYVVSASNLRLLSILLLSTVHLEGNLVAIAGNYSGSIDSVELVAPTMSTTSSIECRPVVTNNVFSATQGTSLLRLALGCPPIRSVTLNFNGTTVSSMAPLSSFSFLLIDNSTALSRVQTPAYHQIILDSLVGTLHTSPLVATLASGGSAGGALPVAYPSYNGTMYFHNCSIDAQGTGNGYVQLYAVDSLLLEFISVSIQECAAIVQPNPTLLDGTSIVPAVACVAAGGGGSSTICVRFRNCSLTVTNYFTIQLTVPAAGGIQATTTNPFPRYYAIILDVVWTTFAIDTNGAASLPTLLRFEDFAVASRMVPIYVNVANSTFDLPNNGIRLIDASALPIGGTITSIVTRLRTFKSVNAGPHSSHPIRWGPQCFRPHRL